MAKKNKEQENHFNLHEYYGSLEELELALSKVADAASAFYDVVEDAKLPPNIAIGMLGMPLHVFVEQDAIEDMGRLAGVVDLMQALGGDR